jgi:membrane fusion protein (multidrug efflux system)
MSNKLSPLFFVAAIALYSCTQSHADSDAKAEATATPKKSFEKVAVTTDTLRSSLSIPGELIPYQQVDLYAKISGYIKELNVDIGSKVKTGQVLMTLDAPELTAQLSTAESRLKSQEALYTASLANYNRLRETSKTPGTISPNDLEQAESKKNADIANLEAARSAYKEINDVRGYLILRAPFDGYVTARNVSVGAYVGPNGKGSDLPAVTLQDQDRLRLVVSIPEEYATYVAQGSILSYKVRSLPSENFKAKVVRLARSLDTKLRSQRVEADIDNRSGKFLAGTVANVSLMVQSAPGSFIVPKTAVVISAEGVFVVRVANGKADRVPVKTGIENNGMIEVRGDLSPNDMIIKKATDEIQTGAAIE